MRKETDTADGKYGKYRVNVCFYYKLQDALVYMMSKWYVSKRWYVQQRV